MTSRTTRALLLLALGASSAAGQTIDDGLLMPKRTVGGGVVYAHDSWDQYWEGALKRSNGNVGTLTTRSITMMAGYGITDRLNVMAMLPYIRTEASQGTLQGQGGLQDLTIGAKYRLLKRESARMGALSAYIVATAALPVGDYTPDFMPLSIGTAGGRAAGRFTLHFQSKSFWFVNASGAYTFCSNVKLDRASYYTDGQLYMTNDVAMPNVLDYSLTAGVHRGRWRVPVSLVQQRTLGGGDMRRQDMPFVSNRMDFVKLDGSAIYDLPKNLSLRLGAAHVLSGRNVGQSTTLTSGLFYAFHF